MAINSTVENLPDTPANAQYFGYPRNDCGTEPFRQAQVVYLVKCGTHAVLDVEIWPTITHERVDCRRLLHLVQPGILIMWNRGMHSYRMLATALTRGAHIFIRLSTSAIPSVMKTLANES